MSNDAAFREAVARYRAALLAKPIPEDAPDAKREEHRAEARVLALYAEAQRQGERDQLALAEQVAEATIRMEQGRAERQGEVYEVLSLGKEPGAVMLYPDGREWEILRLGDKVRVTKVEEGQ